MRSAFVAFTVALSVASAGLAQTPPKPAAKGTPPAAGAASVTVEGCVVKEIDVPTRRPPENVRAQAEADDDYVLISTRMISGTAPSGVAAAPAAGAATGTSGATSSDLMYDIEGIEKDQLRKHAGKRVQIEGVFDHLENAKLPVSFANDLVEIKGTAIRPVPGACPTK